MEGHPEEGIFKQGTKDLKGRAMQKAMGKCSSRNRRHSKYKSTEVAKNLACF